LQGAHLVVGLCLEKTRMRVLFAFRG